MAARKIKDARDARECLSAAKASGLTNAEWARQEGIDGRSLNAWRMNLGIGGKSRGSKRSSKKSRRSKSRPARPRMVELVPSVNSSRSTAPTIPLYAVRCGELTIEVDEHFEEETLRRLVRVVASC